MSRHARQSFLGENSEAVLKALKVGIIGLGGGGAHANQQLTHIGVGHILGADHDVVENTNLNRLVGATPADVEMKTLKAIVADRVYRALNPTGDGRYLACKWQDAAPAFADCDVIIAAVDSYIERNEIEAFCRRFMLPLVDMGMDVHKIGGEHIIAGQVILSSHGHHCLWCMGVLSEKRLEAEAKKYGDAGGAPQVVWPNGVLGSLAVGLVMQLATSWHNAPLAEAYLEYDGQTHEVKISNRLKAIRGVPCPHYPANQVGDPLFDIRATREISIPKRVVQPAPAKPQRFAWLHHLLPKSRRQP